MSKTTPKQESKGFYIKTSFPNYKEVFKNAIHIIDYCFTIDETDYWQFQDFNGVPCERGFNALSFFEELKMKCDKDYLMAFSQALDDVVNNNKGIKITDVVKLNLQLKERLEMITEPDIAFKLCGVVFFDSTENPYGFEYKKTMLKAEEFKKVGAGFFLHGLNTPITQLIPYIGSSANDLGEYFELITQIKKRQIQDISTMLSEQSKNKEFYKRLVLPSTKD